MESFLFNKCRLVMIEAIMVPKSVPQNFYQKITLFIFFTFNVSTSKNPILSILHQLLGLIPFTVVYKLP